MTAYDVPPTLPSIGGIQNYEAGATQESNLQTILSHLSKQ